jgi:hypothetical protein
MSGPKTQTLQEQFIKEIQEKGMEHALTWIGSWYERLAEAQLADRLNDMPVEYHKVHLLEESQGLARVAANYSTSIGQNALQHARVAVTSKAAERALMSLKCDLRAEADVAHEAKKLQPARPKL